MVEPVFTYTTTDDIIIWDFNLDPVNIDPHDYMGVDPATRSLNYLIDDIDNQLSIYT